MSRIVDVEPLITDLTEVTGKMSDGIVGTTTRVLLQRIKELPEIPSMGTTTAHWIEDHYGHWSCSKCGYKVRFSSPYRDTKFGETDDGKFCPCCGARMEAADE